MSVSLLFSLIVVKLIYNLTLSELQQNKQQILQLHYTICCTVILYCVFIMILYLKLYTILMGCVFEGWWV